MLIKKWQNRQKTDTRADYDEENKLKLDYEETKNWAKLLEVEHSVEASICMKFIKN